MHGFKFLTFAVGGTLYCVPEWAPYGVIARAAMRPGARLTDVRPEGSINWAG